MEVKQSSTENRVSVHHVDFELVYATTANVWNFLIAQLMPNG